MYICKKKKTYYEKIIYIYPVDCLPVGGVGGEVCTIKIV